MSEFIGRKIRMSSEKGEITLYKDLSDADISAAAVAFPSVAITACSSSSSRID